MKLKALLATAAAAIGLGACAYNDQPPSGARYPQPNGDFVVVENPNGELMWCRTRVHTEGGVSGNYAYADQSKGRWTKDCQNYPPNERGYDNPNRRNQIQMQRTGERAVYRTTDILMDTGHRKLRQILRLAPDTLDGKIPEGFNTLGAGAASTDDRLLRLAKMGVVELTNDGPKIHVPKSFQFPADGEVVDLDALVEAWKKAPKKELSEVQIHADVASAIAGRNNQPKLTPQ